MELNNHLTGYAPKAGLEWEPRVTPDTTVNPDYFYGCKTVQELSDYYREKQQRGFSVQDLAAAVVCANDGFCDYPILNTDWPKVQLALVLLGVDDFGSKVLHHRGLFKKNRGD